MMYCRQEFTSSKDNMAKTYQVAHKAKFGSNANSNSGFDKIITQEKEKDGKKK